MRVVRLPAVPPADRGDARGGEHTRHVVAVRREADPLRLQQEPLLGGVRQQLLLGERDLLPPARPGAGPDPGGAARAAGQGRRGQRPAPGLLPMGPLSAVLPGENGEVIINP